MLCLQYIFAELRKKKVPWINHVCEGTKYIVFLWLFSGNSIANFPIYIWRTKWCVLMDSVGFSAIVKSELKLLWVWHVHEWISADADPFWKNSEGDGKKKKEKRKKEKRKKEEKKSMIIVVPSCLKDADGARTRSDQHFMSICNQSRNSY